MTCTATILVSVDKTNVATARGFTAEGNPVEDDDDAVVEILTHGLVIAKSNNAPIETIELPDGSTADLPTAPEGSTVTFTLELHLQRRPGHPRSHHGRPADRPDVRGELRDDQQPSSRVVSYNPTTRTLTWTAATVNASGTAELQGEGRHRRRGARPAADQRRDHQLRSDPARR